MLQGHQGCLERCQLPFGTYPPPSSSPLRISLLPTHTCAKLGQCDDLTRAVVVSPALVVRQCEWPRISQGGAVVGYRLAEGGEGGMPCRAGDGIACDWYACVLRDVDEQLNAPMNK
jgi:hypothetical protein